MLHIKPLTLPPSVQQLKNQINALFSQLGGTNPSTSMAQTLVGGQSRKCLLKNVKDFVEQEWYSSSVKHVIRDSWTKLNVSPAKIIQVCLVLCYHKDQHVRVWLPL